MLPHCLTCLDEDTCTLCDTNLYLTVAEDGCVHNCILEDKGSYNAAGFVCKLCIKAMPNCITCLDEGFFSIFYKALKNYKKLLFIITIIDSCTACNNTKFLKSDNS